MDHVINEVVLTTTATEVATDLLPALQKIRISPPKSLSSSFRDYRRKYTDGLATDDDLETRQEHDFEFSIGDGTTVYQQVLAVVKEITLNGMTHGIEGDRARLHNILEHSGKSDPKRFLSVWKNLPEDMPDLWRELSAELGPIRDRILQKFNAETIDLILAAGSEELPDEYYNLMDEAYDAIQSASEEVIRKINQDSISQITAWQQRAGIPGIVVTIREGEENGNPVLEVTVANAITPLSSATPYVDPIAASHNRNETDVRVHKSGLLQTLEYVQQSLAANEQFGTPSPVFSGYPQNKKGKTTLKANRAEYRFDEDGKVISVTEPPSEYKPEEILEPVEDIKRGVYQEITLLITAEK